MTTLSLEPTGQDAAEFRHETVLRDEVVAAVAEAPAGWAVDCTLGGGGHAEAILAQCPQLSLLGLDRDPAALAAASARLAPFGARFAPVQAPFAELAQVCAARGLTELSAIVADLGVSSHQLDTAERGFSFRFEGPLDMRMDPTQGPTLAELLETVTLEDLADVLYNYGDIRHSIGTARIVLQAYREGAATTGELARHLARRLPRERSMHPATQVFQALRIWVNGELAQLETLLHDGPQLLAKGGVMAVISFHSGEDRLVKQAFMALAPRKYGEFLRPQRKGMVPEDKEQEGNPRSRSARLRVLERAGAREEESGGDRE